MEPLSRKEKKPGTPQKMGRGRLNRKEKGPATSKCTTKVLGGGHLESQRWESYCNGRLQKICLE